MLAAVGLILLARSEVPAVGAVLLGAGVLGAVVGLVIAVRNVRAARALARRRRRASAQQRQRDGGPPVPDL